MRKFISAFLIASMMALFVSAAPINPFSGKTSEKANDAGPNVIETSGIARAEKDIPVPQPKPDELISSRLQKILSITKWFNNLQVTSQEGVVTLSGTVEEASQRDWAIKMAQDAEGVVAVINKISLTEGGWLDLEPTEKEVKKIWKTFFAKIPHLIIAALILIAAIFLYRRATGYSLSFWKQRLTNPILSEVMGKIGALPILLLGLYLMLQVLNLTGLAFTILGGTGALGLVAGFAFKNILENYFSGIIISIRKPFIIGDVVQIGNEKGVVFKMTTRGITLLDFDGTHILIPNSTVFTSVIKNQTANPLARVHLVFERHPDKPIDQQRQEVIDYLRMRPEIVRDPDLETFISGKESQRKIEVYFWVNNRETSVEKLKAVIVSQLTPKTNGTAAQAITPEKPVSTKSEVSALLQRAAAYTGHDPNEKSLVKEHREGAKSQITL
jgi:small conductance mechanosensitive channel